MGAMFGHVGQLFWGLFLVTVVFALAGVSIPRKRKARAAFRSASVWFSLCVLLLSALLAVESQVVLGHAHNYRRDDAAQLASTLGWLCLREAAYGRGEEFVAAATAERKLQAERVERPVAWPGGFKSRLMRRIGSYLPIVAQDAVASKRLLATASLFWERQDGLAEYERVRTNVTSAILSAAHATSGQEFDSADSFFEWLELRRGTEGWDPLPVYEFSNIDVDKELAKAVEEARRRKEQAETGQDLQDRVAPASSSEP